ncbi:MAG TPA: oxidoreductase [Jiangellales bacterium]|nr:oxidoreductase [Jiangellales bacterium]
MTDDPFAAVAALEGVGAAAAHARDAVDALLRHPAMRRGWAPVAAESALRGARASAALDGGDPESVDDPVLQGALRATAEVPSLARTCERAPLQVLARLHVLAARDLPGADQESLGRPDVPAAADRLTQLCRIATSPTDAPSVVVAAIVHGELRAVRPFASADGVVARAAERLVLVARGLDTKAVLVPEAGHLASGEGYRQAAAAYVEGSAAGVGTWVRHCCDAYARGAEEGLAVCVAAASGS